METQKIANLLNDSNNETLKFAARKWYIFHDQIMENMAKKRK